MYAELRSIEIYWNQATEVTCFYLKAFLRNKKGPDLVSLHQFLHGFWIKIFLLLYSIN